ncbi:MAG: hypothetical protein V4534_00795 [Myxococcota bacterium]
MTRLLLILSLHAGFAKAYIPTAHIAGGTTELANYFAVHHALLFTIQKAASSPHVDFIPTLALVGGIQMLDTVETGVLVPVINHVPRIAPYNVLRELPEVDISPSVIYLLGYKGFEIDQFESGKRAIRRTMQLAQTFFSLQKIIDLWRLLDPPIKRVPTESTSPLEILVAEISKDSLHDDVGILHDNPAVLDLIGPPTSPSISCSPSSLDWRPPEDSSTTTPSLGWQGLLGSPLMEQISPARTPIAGCFGPFIKPLPIPEGERSTWIGSGGLGTVYVVKPSNGPSFALKEIPTIPVLHQQLGKSINTNDDLHYSARLLVEVRALNALSGHPHIPKLLGYALTPGCLKIAMDLLEGQPLSPLTPLPAGRLKLVISQVLKALQFAHASGISHQDIKPTNIFLDIQNTATLIDWGEARFFKPLGSPFISEQYLPKGTPGYGHPTSSNLIERDFYALGITAQQMLRQEDISSKWEAFFTSLKQGKPDTAWLSAE